MVRVDLDGQDVYFDGYLKTNLDSLKKMVAKDFDCPIAVDGGEGFGKSLFAMQIAKYLDPTLTLDRIVFNAEDFIAQVQKAKPQTCIVFDEAYGGLSGRETMTKVNRVLCKMLAEIRQKNLYIIFVCPSFFDLDKYVALWRTRALIHVYLEKGLKRGYFKFYNYPKKKLLYILGKKTYNYGATRCNFFGSFGPKYVVDEKAYKAKKLEALSDYQEVELTKTHDERFPCLLYWLRKHKGMNYKEIAEGMTLCGLKTNDDPLRKVVHRWSKKVGGRNDEERNEEVDS